MSSTLEILLIITLAIVIFSLGLYVGRFIANSQAGSQDSPKGFLKTQGKPNNNSSSIEIDSTKVVLKVDTEGMEKKFDKITESKSVKNDISSSVNKLKSMKGK
jgi:hypothetical protein